MPTPVITGMAIVSAPAIGKHAFLKAMQEGLCGIGEVGLFDTSDYRGGLGAEVKGFPRDLPGMRGWLQGQDGPFSTEILSGIDETLSRWIQRDARRLRRISRGECFGLLAMAEAMSDAEAGISKKRGLFLETPSERLAVVMGSGSGGLFSAEEFKRKRLNGQRARPSLLVPFCSSSFTDLVAMLVGSRGYRCTIATACSSSATAIGMAGELIRTGAADVVITGGCESLSETTFAGFNSLRAVDEVPCRPFDKHRKGISLGEGAAIFIVVALDKVKDTKAPYAEVAGYGLSADAYHVTSPSEDGIGIAAAINAALKESGITPGDVDYINAHGTGTVANDRAETQAIKNAFGKRAYEIPISSTKSMFGHCLGAAGAMEAVASVLSIMHGVIHPTVNFKTPDQECDLDYVPGGSRQQNVDVVLSNSLAFGGNNTALVLRKVR